MPPDRQSGFTLIELMVTIAVLAVLLAWGLPNFQNSLRSNRVATSTNEVLASVSLARSEAIRSTRGAGICASSDGTGCNGASWSDGWMVFADTNANGSFDAGDTVLKFSRGSDKLSAALAPAGVIAFDARGRRRAAGDQVLTLKPSECGGQPLQRTLTINASGQVRTAKGDCS